MKRYLVLVVIGTSMAFSSLAQVQNSEFQKLFDLYTMEDYDRCAYKAEKYTQKDKYRREPEPYLYMALCFYQAHIQPEKFDQEFDDPLKDALKYAYKFRKKDKSGELYESNRDLLDKIREEALHDAKFYYSEGDYRKAASEFRRIQKVIPDDVNVLFMTGVAQIQSRNTAEGERNVNIALDTLRAQRMRGAFEKDPVTHDVLVKGFVSYSDYLAENNRLEEAMATMTFARQLDPADPTLKAHYKKIYALAPEEEDED